MKRALPWMLAAVLLTPAALRAQEPAKSEQVKRGEYLVTTGLCHDCHTPARHDAERSGAGHEACAVGPSAGHRRHGASSASGPWMGSFWPTLTAWSGPWGVSFSANLTPDPETGRLRDFTEEQFVQTLRTGRHQGQGRQILPPMPWPFIGKMTDDDLKAIFAYLRQVQPIKNKVPDPLPPAQ